MAFESPSLAESIISATAFSCCLSGAGGMLVALGVPDSPPAEHWRATCALVMFFGTVLASAAILLSRRRAKAGR